MVLKLLLLLINNVDCSASSFDILHETEFGPCEASWLVQSSGSGGCLKQICIVVSANHKLLISEAFLRSSVGISIALTLWKGRCWFQLIYILTSITTCGTDFTWITAPHKTLLNYANYRTSLSPTPATVKEVCKGFKQLSHN